MGSGMDLAKIIPSVLFGFFIFAVFIAANTKISNGYGIGINENGTFNINTSVTAGKNIESTVHDKGVNSATNQFFPAIDTLITVWDQSKGALKDLTQIIQRFTAKVANGEPLIIMLQNNIIATILISITFVILGLLFAKGGGAFKER